MRIFQVGEVVEIFHHLLFLAVSQLDNITVWKLVWVVSYGFIHLLRLNSIQLGNIPIEDNLLISNDDNFVLCFTISSFCPISLKFDFGCKDNKNIWNANKYYEKHPLLGAADRATLRAFVARKQPTNSQKGIFRPSKPFSPSSRGISRSNAKKRLKLLYFTPK